MSAARVTDVGSASNRRSRLWFALAIVLLTLGAGACSGESSEAGTGQSQVFGYDDVFAPDIIKVDLRTEIEWRMEGANPHNVHQPRDLLVSPGVKAS